MLTEKYTNLEALTSSPNLALKLREECPDLDVRIAFDKDSQPWFVLKDYCHSIGLTITADILDILPKENIALVDMTQENIQVACMFAKNMTHVYFINQAGADLLINAAHQQANEQIEVGMLGERTNTIGGNYNTEGISTSNVRLWSKPNIKNAEEWEVGSNKLKTRPVMTEEEINKLQESIDNDLLSPYDYPQVFHSSGNNELEIKVGQVDAQGFIPILIKTLKPNEKFTQPNKLN